MEREVCLSLQDLFLHLHEWFVHYPPKLCRKSLASGEAVLLKKRFFSFIMERSFFSWWKITFLLLSEMIWLQSRMNGNFQKEYDFQQQTSQYHIQEGALCRNHWKQVLQLSPWVPKDNISLILWLRKVLIGGQWVSVSHRRGRSLNLTLGPAISRWRSAFASLLGGGGVLWESWLTLALHVQTSAWPSSGTLLVGKTTWEPVMELVSCCCRTQHCQFDNWKQDAFTVSAWIHSFCESGSSHSWSASLLRISLGCNWDANWAVGVSGAWLPLRSHMIISRI